MERKEIDHITSLLNMASNDAARTYPSLKEEIAEIVNTYNRKISPTQRAALLAILIAFREAVLIIDKK